MESSINRPRLVAISGGRQGRVFLRERAKRIPENTSTEDSAARSSFIKRLMLAGLEQSGVWYRSSVSTINKNRNTDSKAPTLSEKEIRERAEAWLSSPRLEAANRHLLFEKGKPPILLPVPNIEVSHREIVETWRDARQGKIKKFAGQLAFIEQWPANQLSGYDPNSGPLRLLIVEAGFSLKRSSKRKHQDAEWHKIQSADPGVRPVNLLEGAVLAHRYNDQVNPYCFDYYVSLPGLDPDSDHRLPRAYIGSDGYVEINAFRESAKTFVRRAVS